MINCAVILAGGKGSRLASITANTPKPLVPVGGWPVLAHQLDLLRAAGFYDVRIFAGYLAEQIEEFVMARQWPGQTIRFEIEAAPLGSAGAVIAKLNSLPEHFVILYGDTMMAVNLRRMADFHTSRGADVTALIHPNDHPADSDIVEIDTNGRITAVHPYPHLGGACYRNLVSAALYVMRREALRPWMASTVARDFAKDIFPSMLLSGVGLYGYHSHEYIKDMGTPARLENVTRDWTAGRIRPNCGNIRTPVVLLDRDGTLNMENGYIRCSEQFHLLKSVPEALKLMREAGYRLIVVTNQPVVARGEATEADLAAIHRKLEWELGLGGAYLDAIIYCPHHPDAGFPGERLDLKKSCDCRKPAPGMFNSANAEFQIDLARSWMIGDTTIDLEFARRVGLRSVLVRTGSGGRDGKFPKVQPYCCAGTLLEAAQLIVKETPPILSS